MSIADSWVRSGPAGRFILVVCGMLSLMAAPMARGAVAQTCEVARADSVAVRKVAEGIVKADNARDLGRVLDYYAEDAVLHPPMESDVVGRAAIRPRYESLFGSYDPEIIAELRAASVCGDLAVVTGRNGGFLRGRDGRADRELGDAFVMVLRKDGGVWLIRRLIWHPDR